MKCSGCDMYQICVTSCLYYMDNVHFRVGLVVIYWLFHLSFITWVHNCNKLTCSESLSSTNVIAPLAVQQGVWLMECHGNHRVSERVATSQSLGYMEIRYKLSLCGNATCATVTLSDLSHIVMILTPQQLSWTSINMKDVPVTRCNSPLFAETFGFSQNSEVCATSTTCAKNRSGCDIWWCCCYCTGVLFWQHCQTEAFLSHILE